MSHPFHVLIVCTGNICRSPAAERLLQAALTSPTSLRVTSAGTHALVGFPMDPPTAQALQKRETTADGHRARLLTPAEVADADLVLGATRAHRAAAVSLYPKAVHYAYTVKEFARLASHVISRPDYQPVPPHELLAEVRRMRGLMGPARPDDDDIADPYGRTAAEHDVTVAAIAVAVEPIAAALSRGSGLPESQGS